MGIIAGAHQTSDPRNATELKLSVGRENPSAEPMGPICGSGGATAISIERANDARDGMEGRSELTELSEP